MDVDVGSLYDDGRVVSSAEVSESVVCQAHRTRAASRRQEASQLARVLAIWRDHPARRRAPSLPAPCGIESIGSILDRELSGIVARGQAATEPSDPADPPEPGRAA